MGMFSAYTFQTQMWIFIGKHEPLHTNKDPHLGLEGLSGKHTHGEDDQARIRNNTDNSDDFEGSLPSTNIFGAMWLHTTEDLESFIKSPRDSQAVEPATKTA